MTSAVPNKLYRLESTLITIDLVVGVTLLSGLFLKVNTSFYWWPLLMFIVLVAPGFWAATSAWVWPNTHPSKIEHICSVRWHLGLGAWLMLMIGIVCVAQSQQQPNGWFIVGVPLMLLGWLGISFVLRVRERHAMQLTQSSLTI